LEPFVRFDFPTIGHIYDTNGQPLMEMATEYRSISMALAESRNTVAIWIAGEIGIATRIGHHRSLIEEREAPPRFDSALANQLHLG
jgi:hypothetical protein